LFSWTYSGVKGLRRKGGGTFALPLRPGAVIEALAAGSPDAARAVLALYRTWRVARGDANGIALPSGRRILLPNEEVRYVFDDHANHFPGLEDAVETLATALGPTAPAEMNYAERLRTVRGVRV
jgi:hypothetical protein